MQTQTRVTPWWAALIVWGVVNAVNLLQGVGFLSRVFTGERYINQLLGYGMIALAIPTILAIVAFGRARASWRQWIGPAMYLIFIALLVAVDYVWPVEFRSPRRYSILAPYLLLFFGAILLMGLPMFRMDRRLWLVTGVTSALLLGSMGIAMFMGVG